MIPTHRKLLGTLGLAVVSGSILVTSVSGASQRSDSVDSSTTHETSTEDEPRSDVQALADLNLAPVQGNNVDLKDLNEVDIQDWDDLSFEDWDDLEDFDIEDFDIEDFDFEDWEPTAEDIAEINEWVDAEKDALDNAGINYTTKTDEHGIDYLEWDETDDEAAWAALDTLYETLFEAFEIQDWDDFDGFDFDGFDIEDFDIEDFDFEDWEPTAEDIAEINEWVDAEKDALDNAGINYTTKTDEHGIDYLEWDETDDEAAWAALDTLYESLFEAFEIQDWDDFDGFDIDDFDIDASEGSGEAAESDS